jgi:hypothetical protein
MAGLTAEQCQLVAKLARESGLSPEQCVKCLKATNWTYELTLRNLTGLKTVIDSKIMTTEDKIELILLKTVLEDSFYCKRLDQKTLDNLIDKYTRLLDKFVQQYELPNSINDPIRD